MKFGVIGVLAFRCAQGQRGDENRKEPVAMQQFSNAIGQAGRAKGDEAIACP